jgi:FkbM family methyltransferase
MKLCLKDQVRDFLEHRFGIRVFRSKFYPSTYDRQNFPNAGTHPVIFDVGANTGQSVVAFKQYFPDATIYAFEPVAAIHNKLQQNTNNLPSVRLFQCALGKSKGVLDIPLVGSESVQTTQVLANSESVGGACERINVSTVDEVAREHGVNQICILKTDTEGFDTEVCEGAAELLREGRITYIVSEASIQPEDSQHTRFRELCDTLDAYRYAPRSFLDLVHAPGKQLWYFNVLFERLKS